MLGWKDEMMKQEQYNELLREAENRALVQQALLERKRRTPLVGSDARGVGTTPHRPAMLLA